MSVTEDVGTASQAVTAFVNAYNTVVQNVNQEYTVGANGVQGPLAGDSTLGILQDMLLGSGSLFERIRPTELQPWRTWESR